MYYLPKVSRFEWCGLPIQRAQDQHHQSYLKRIHALLMDCLDVHPRWMVVRIDLHGPSGHSIPAGAVTRFVESVKAQLEHVRQTKRSAGKRGYDPMLRYVWVREWNEADQPHYHIALLLNRDAYFSLGNYGRLNEPDQDYDAMLAGRICKAWGVALGVDWRQAKAGVHFPEHPVSALACHSPRSKQQLYGVFYRLSYFAKLQTKQYGEGDRNFGMSQLRCIQTSQD
jgi:hypothetical protein